MLLTVLGEVHLREFRKNFPMIQIGFSRLGWESILSFLNPVDMNRVKQSEINFDDG